MLEFWAASAAPALFQKYHVGRGLKHRVDVVTGEALVLVEERLDTARALLSTAKFPEENDLFLPAARQRYRHKYYGIAPF